MTAAVNEPVRNMPADIPADPVVIAYVHHRDVAYSWHHSMIELLGYDLANHGRIMAGGYLAMKCNPERDAIVDARNKAVRLFLTEHDAPWLFWVDTDMAFPADALERLIASADPDTAPIVGALAFTQREEASDGLGGWRCRATPTVFDWLHLDTGELGYTVWWDYPVDSVVQCAGTGAACVLIHRSVFERIEAEYGPRWYDRVRNPTMDQVVSEDLSFCLRAGALKIPVHVDTSVKTTHMKILWLGETDYFGQVTLAQLLPTAPPAVEKCAVIVPTLRAGNAQPFMRSLAESGAADLCTVYAVTEDPDVGKAWDEAGAVVLEAAADATYASKANQAYQTTREPWLLMGADDLKFHPGWLDQAQAAGRDGAHVIGTNDMHNPRVVAGEHATHPLVRRAYVDETGAGWDGPGVLCHEGYGHWFVDDEIVTAAKRRGVWAFAPHARVEHLHPFWGLADDDDVYQRGQATVDDDRVLFAERSRAAQ